MIKLAKISSINKQAVVLDFQDNLECSDCKSNCANGFLNFLFHRNNNKMVVALQDSGFKDMHLIVHLIDKDSFFTKQHKEQHQVNDIIGMKFNEDQLLKFSLLLYGLPIVLLTLSLILGYVLFNQLNLNPDLGGLLGLILGLIFAKIIINRFKIKSIPRVEFFK